MQTWYSLNKSEVRAGVVLVVLADPDLQSVVGVTAVVDVEVHTLRQSREGVGGWVTSDCAE